MEIEDAKKFVMQATTNGASVERCKDNKFIRLAGAEKSDEIFLKALESLHSEGQLVQVPNSSQTWSTVSFIKASNVQVVKQITSNM